ncbi:MAG: phosphoribosyltransferase [Dehalococcoidales bacterium]|nr:phosphoribosyltransferase [Dehalococcoidales bacterium]
MIYENREQAGQQLAGELSEFRGTDTLVLALPRGGVVVGYQVAVRLNLALDVIVTRKIGAPGNPEYAIGAVSETGDVQLNNAEIAYLGIPTSYVSEEIAHQRREIERRGALYRGGRGRPNVTGRHVILVDDGIATGFTMFASVRALRSESPAELVVAVPVAPPSTVRTLEAEVDRVVCPSTPEPFMAVGAWYRHFDQVTDEEVRQYLRLASNLPSPGGMQTTDQPGISP